MGTERQWWGDLWHCIAMRHDRRIRIHSTIAFAATITPWLN